MKTSSIQDPKKRFAFGKNWSKFLDSIDEDRIQEAQKSLCGTLGIHDFSGKTFLDIGSGSGLFSLAAHRLGARVYSFDYDLQSVDCTKALKEKYAKNTNTWSVEQGSVLDGEFLKKFDNIDIVYSWGVLHHTGHMHQALQNVSGLVRGGGSLFISIYNDQGKPSKIWKKIKKLYVDYPYCRGILTVFCGLWLWRYQFILGLVRHGNPLYFVREYKKNNRGMSAWRDVVDWVGGYPFEVAKPEEIFDFFRSKDFELRHLKTCFGYHGCNEFVFFKNIPFSPQND